MSASGFCRYELRTTDIEGARRFYADLLGPDFWGGGITMSDLPAQAAARGAPPHWLGHIGVDDVVGATLRLVEAGAARPGAAAGSPIDSAGAIVRDPSGALVGLTPGMTRGAGNRVVWHLLTARDEARALAVYEELFDWTAIENLELGAGGRHVTFSWDGTDRPAGSVSDLAGRPHVHPQWLFFFRTAELDAALARVREAGGLTLPPMRNMEGERIAVCDDPQGAAFALCERSD